MYNLKIHIQLEIWRAVLPGPLFSFPLAFLRVFFSDSLILRVVVFAVLEVAKFPRFPSVPNFLLGIASGFVRALTRKSGEKMNIRFVADSTPQNGKNPSRHDLDIIPPEGLQVSDLSISPFWDGHSIFGEKVTQNEQIWHFYT